jgi:hypothetical protein
MFCARWLSALGVLLAIGCSESPGHFAEGTFENAESGAEQHTLPPEDLSTDPAVTLLGAGTSTNATPTDAGIETPPVSTPASEPPPSAPDAGPMEQPIADDGDDEADESDVPENDGSMTEPEPPPDEDNSSLVGTVCDLLGGLLCPVGLLCVDGLCQEA